MHILYYIYEIQHILTFFFLKQILNTIIQCKFYGPQNKSIYLVNIMSRTLLGTRRVCVMYIILIMLHLDIILYRYL